MKSVYHRQHTHIKGFYQVISTGDGGDDGEYVYPRIKYDATAADTVA